MFYRPIDEILEFGERHDLVEFAQKFLLPRSKYGAAKMRILEFAFLPLQRRIPSSHWITVGLIRGRRCFLPSD